MSPDPRFALLPLYKGYYQCPAENCTTENHGIFTAVIRGPDLNQRAVWACAEHLPLYVEVVLNHLRLKPPPGL